MKFLVKSTTPIKEGNAAIKDGSMATLIQSVIEDLKPEAVYFSTENGQRTGYWFVEIEEASQIPAVAEPLFLGLNCDLEILPVMTPEDFAQAGPGIENAVRKYG